MASPRVSVLITTRNGAELIGETIASILAQNFTDFEIVVVDDGSTDETPSILAACPDPRLRLHRTPRNLGVVGARNFGFPLCRGEYLAASDHDDLSHPERLALQVDYLDRNPGVVLVGSDVQIAERGRLRSSGHAKGATPRLMRWLLHVDNPLTYSSIMVRAEAIRCLSIFMRREYEFADDYDLYHRLLGIGEIARLDEALTIYRWHSSNTSHVQGGPLLHAAAKILGNAYAPWLGKDAGEAAMLVARHLSGREPPSPATLRRIGFFLERIKTGFLASHALAAGDRALIEHHASRLWWQTARGTIRDGSPQALLEYRSRAALTRQFKPGPADQAGSLAIGALRSNPLTRPLIEWLKR